MRGGGAERIGDAAEHAQCVSLSSLTPRRDGPPSCARPMDGWRRVVSERRSAGGDESVRRLMAAGAEARASGPPICAEFETSRTHTRTAPPPADPADAHRPARARTSSLVRLCRTPDPDSTHEHDHCTERTRASTSVVPVEFCIHRPRVAVRTRTASSSRCRGEEVPPQPPLPPPPLPPCSCSWSSRTHCAFRHMS